MFEGNVYYSYLTEIREQKIHKSSIDGVGTFNYMKCFISILPFPVLKLWDKRMRGYLVPWGVRPTF
jgi:hypothetical protein